MRLNTRTKRIIYKREENDVSISGLKTERNKGKNTKKKVRTRRKGYEYEEATTMLGECLRGTFETVEEGEGCGMK
jgi:hypothetical protein